jgi:hypothetical protein
MQRAIVETVSRYAAGVASLAIGAAWSAPVWERADVQTLGVIGAQSLTIIGVAAGGVLTIGYTWNRLATWAAIRPPVIVSPALPVQFANDHEALTLAHEEAQADDTPNRVDGWQAAITKFALLGNLGGFGWRAMCRFCGQDDWKVMLGLMVGAEVLMPPRGRRAAQWGGGWCFSKFRLALKHGRLSLPFPDSSSPVVVWEKAYPLRKLS